MPPRQSTAPLLRPAVPVQPVQPVQHDHTARHHREEQPAPPPPAGAVAEVRRGAEAEQVTRRAGARAATRDGVVYLPDRAGPVDSPVAQGLLAHELVHVRAHDPEPPIPDVALDLDGEEQAALAVEAAVRSGRAPAPSLTRTYLTDPPSTPGTTTYHRSPPSNGSPSTLHTAPEAPRAEPAPDHRATRPQDDDLDRLYRLLRTRLLDDLLVDRERTGGVIDLRRG